MISDEKILVTGPAGQIAFPLCEALARDNEVWGIARFSDPSSRERVEAIGVTTRVSDLAAGDFADVPQDFSVVLHLAAHQGPDLNYDHALRVNAEGTGLLLAHCRRARAALVMSTHSVYRPHADVHHVFRETDPLGEVNSQHCPTYSMAKIGQESVARTCSRLFGLPVVIARMNASYGANGGLPAYHMDSVVAGRPVVTRWDPCLYSPIHEDDIIGQTGALLDAASVPALVVNWAGDEAVSVQEWCAYMGDLAGTGARVEVQQVPGTHKGSVADVTLRSSITGPCQVDWRTGVRRTFQRRHGGPSPVGAI
ncbi:MAG TPA: NAD(P)-dependent oxidoreductase [Acidimicrobiales bacterium]|nr:NAD(P)-dependent oxidoreductase [Acidimicrobiales bacterium]